MKRGATIIDLELRALSLAETCRRIGYSLRTGERLVASGLFPIPELPRTARGRHRYSSTDVELYLRTASRNDHLRRVLARGVVAGRRPTSAAMDQVGVRTRRAQRKGTGEAAREGQDHADHVA